MARFGKGIAERVELGSGGSPGGSAGDIQVNNGSGGFGGISVVPISKGGWGGTTADTSALNFLPNVSNLVLDPFTPVTLLAYDAIDGVAGMVSSSYLTSLLMAAGSGSNVQYKNAIDGSFQGAANLNYFPTPLSTGSYVRINSGATTVGLVVQAGVTSPGALVQFKNSGGTILGSISATATASFASLTGTNLTSGLVPYVSTGGLLTNSSAFAWDNASSTLNITGTVNATTLTGGGSGITGLTFSQISGTATVPQGGTGATSFTTGQILVGNGTSAISSFSTFTFASNLFTVNTGASTANTALISNSGVTNAQVLTVNFAGGNVGASGDANAVMRIASNSTLRDPLSITVSGTNMLNVSGAGRSTFGGGAYIEPFGSASWINMPTTAASGIGNGGQGVNAWIAYVFSANQWFTGASSGDLAYRNTGGKILIGAHATRATVTLGTNEFVGIGYGAASNPPNLLTLKGDSGPVSGFTEGQLVIYGATNTNKRLQIGVDTSSGTMASFMQSVEAGGATRPLNVQPQGGSFNVGPLPPSFANAVFTSAATSDYNNPLTWSGAFINSGNTSKFFGMGYDASLTTGSANGAYFLQGFFAGSTANIPCFINPQDGDTYIGKDGAAQNLYINGNCRINKVGGALYIKQGTGGMSGTATMTSGVATVSITGLTTSDNCSSVTLITPGGTMGARVKAVCTANTLTLTAVGTTGLTVTSETSTYYYEITRPA